MSTNDIKKITPPYNSGVPSTQLPQTKVKTDNEPKAAETVTKNEQQSKEVKTASLETMWQNLSVEELKKVTDWLNNSMRLFNFRLQFEVRQHPNHVTVKVLDKDTGEVIREVPPESLSSIIDRMRDEMGFFVDEII